MIYLDNHTATKPSKGAVEAMERFLAEDWGRPEAPHLLGQRLHSPLHEFTNDLRQLLGARSSDSIFFSPDPVRRVIRHAYIEMAHGAGRNHFVTSNVDEAPTILTYEQLLGLGCEMTMAPVNDRGILSVDALAESLTPRTGLVSLSWANGLTGVIQPVAELAELCRERGIWFHLDASHVLGRHTFDLDEIAPDFISFDLMHAPQGTGALWVRSGIPMDSDPVPMAQLAALAVAAREAREGLDRFSLEVTMLRRELEKDRQVLFASAERLPHVTTLAFPGVASDALLYALNQRNLYASFGGGRYQQLGLQLEACGIRHPLADCAVSFSLSRFTTSDEIKRANEIIDETVTQLQTLSEAVWAL